MTTGQLDQIVAISLALLAIMAVFVCGAAMNIVPQIVRTLMSYEKLADTLETELKPTLVEVKEVLQGVNQLRQITSQRVTEVGQKVTEVSHRVEDAAGSMGHAADSAKKQSTVWSTGLLAGIKSYLAGQTGQDKDSKGSGFDSAS